MTQKKSSITFRANLDEKELICNEAKSRSLPLGTYCRFIILEKIKKMGGQ